MAESPNRTKDTTFDRSSNGDRRNAQKLSSFLDLISQTRRRMCDRFHEPIMGLVRKIGESEKLFFKSSRYACQSL